MASTPQPPAEFQWNSWEGEDAAASLLSEVADPKIKPEAQIEKVQEVKDEYKVAAQGVQVIAALRSNVKVQAAQLLKTKVQAVQLLKIKIKVVQV